MQSDSVLKGLGYGAFAAMLGDLVTMPIDVTKTRLQLSGEGGKQLYKNAFDCAAQTARKEGVGALWKGLEPALWRQASYGSLKYGLYTPIKRAIAGPGGDAEHLPLTHKILAGALSGSIAQGVANPTDLVKIRMMQDGMAGQGGGGQIRRNKTLSYMLLHKRALRPMPPTTGGPQSMKRI